MSLPKVEDAFTAWFSRYQKNEYEGAFHEMPRVLGGPRSISKTIAQAAFLAGAEYGAAAGCAHVVDAPVAKAEGDGKRYRLTTAVHPEIVVRWFLDIHHYWFDESIGPNMFKGMYDTARKYLDSWIETGELAPDRTTLEIHVAMKFSEWLESSWTLASDRPGESAKGGRADSPAGAKTSPAGDKSPVCAAVQFAGGLPCTFPRGHVGGMHSWNFTWANREVAS